MKSHHHVRWPHLRILFSIGLTVLLFLSCSRSEFDRQHNQALFENPSGVELEIRTRDGRQQFAASEPVQFEELYTSKYSGLWHIEVLDGWNEASNATSSDVVHITDGKTTWNQAREPFVGWICCDSRHVWLSLDTTRIPYKLFTGQTRNNREGWVNPEWYTLHLPTNPGKYQVYITTKRVFGRSASIVTYEGKGVPVSSNVIKLEVK